MILDYLHVFCLIVDLYCGPGLVFDLSSRLLALGSHVKIGDVFERFPTLAGIAQRVMIRAGALEASSKVVLESLG